MIRTETGLVRKYFEPLDSFVTLRVYTRSEAADMLARMGALDRRHYLRKVVDACVVDYAENIRPRIEQSFGAASMDDLDVTLYQCCIEANPCLEIHSVLIPVTDGAPRMAPETSPDAPIAAPERLAEIEQRLKARVFGQDEAVEIVASAVRRSAAGVRPKGRPVGCFLFAGPSGVGKTELARALADELHGPGSLVRIDCSEYAMPHEYAKLIGAPPGYIGHSEGGSLTEALRERPASVVLFDEIEKADSRLHGLLLQVADEGHLTDNRGRRVSFSRAVVILTSNLGTRETEEMRRRAGFDSARERKLSAGERREATTVALRQCFSPEFLGRLDAVCVFTEMDQTSLGRVVERKLSELSARLAEGGRRASFSPACRRLLLEEGTSEESGARELARAIARLVEDPVSEMILRGRLPAGSQVRVSCRKRSMRFAVAA